MHTHALVHSTHVHTQAHVCTYTLHPHARTHACPRRQSYTQPMCTCMHCTLRPRAQTCTCTLCPSARAHTCTRMHQYTLPTCTYMHVHTPCTFRCTCIHMHAFVHQPTCTSTHMHMHLCVQRMCTHTCTRVYACAACIHMIMHAHTCAHSLLREVEDTPAAGESDTHRACPTALIQPFLPHTTFCHTFFTHREASICITPRQVDKERGAGGCLGMPVSEHRCSGEILSI